jgi:hypothetical protein
MKGRGLVEVISVGGVTNHCKNSDASSSDVTTESNAVVSHLLPICIRHQQVLNVDATYNDSHSILN